MSTRALSNWRPPGRPGSPCGWPRLRRASAITASRLFGILKLPVTMTNDRQEVALEKLKRGELAALAFVAGKPAPLFHDLKADSGLHFLAVPFNSAVAAAYVPTRLTASDYP